MLKTANGNVNPTVPNGIVSLILLALAGAFIYEAMRAVRKPKIA